MAVVSFPIPSRSVQTGTTKTVFGDVTSQVSGRSRYTVAIDVSGWQSTENLAFGIEFRIDSNPNVVPGCQITTNGGVHHDMLGNVALPSCSEFIPAFASKLEARATFTAPSAGSFSGSIDLF